MPKTTVTGRSRPGSQAAAAEPAPVGWLPALAVATAVSLGHAWLLTDVDLSWPDWVILLLVSAPLQVALAVRPWFTLTHLHWWVAVLAAAWLSLTPPLVLLVGSSWVLTHTVRAWRRGYWRPARPRPREAAAPSGQAATPRAGAAR